MKIQKQKKIEEIEVKNKNERKEGEGKVSYYTDSPESMISIYYDAMVREVKKLKFIRNS